MLLGKVRSYHTDEKRSWLLCGVAGCTQDQLQKSQLLGQLPRTPPYSGLPLLQHNREELRLENTSVPKRAEQERLPVSLAG